MKYLDEWLQTQKHDYAVQYIFDNKWSYWISFDMNETNGMSTPHIELNNVDTARMKARQMAYENGTPSRVVKISKYTPNQDTPINQYDQVAILEILGVYVPPERR